MVALPSVLSTGLGLNAALAVLNTVTPGRVEVADLSVGWGTPLRAKELRIRDRPSKEAEESDEGRQGEVLLAVSEATCSDGLWELMKAAGTRYNLPDRTCQIEPARYNLPDITCQI